MRARLLQNFATFKGAKKPLTWQGFAAAESHDLVMRPDNYRQILALNVRRLMEERPDLATPAKLAKRCFWLTGKRAGKRVAPRTIRYLLDTSEDQPGPGLDLVAAVAAALQVELWELLVDTQATRRRILERLLEVQNSARLP